MTVIEKFEVTRQVVALTFDDGPDPTYTPQLLDLLANESIPATFFALGLAIDKETTPIVCAALDAGHDVGNHTFHHRSFDDPSLDDASAMNEIARTHYLLEQITDRPPDLIRPPYGHGPQRVDRLAAELGYRATVNFEFSHGDWDQPPARAIVDSALRTVTAGSIVLLHDGCAPEQRGGSRRETVEAVRLLIPELRERGFAFATVSTLLDETV
ncbi:MAG TPA: polysaccharide deacetylase family protein [Gaiellaceae bacterium]|jgi:peptidoglycan/xylan/chitin deacetylase (PgdA/CDA1 family)|nr:polysaccharide deacetylase family protein [Gaiellaceae bacterium]